MTGPMAGIMARLGDAATRPAVRVWLLTTLLAIGGALLYVLSVSGRGYAMPDGLRLPWPLVAVGFLFAELKVVDVHFMREKHSFSLNEFPAVIALFALTPGDYLLAVVAGTGLALVRSRQAPVKFAFNLVNFAAVAVLALSIFHVGVDLAHGNSIVIWVATFLATFSGAVLSSVTIAAAITLSGGAPQFQKLPEMIQFGGMVAIANTSLALLAVASIAQDPTLLLLFGVPLLIVFLAYRAYLSEREKHERLELLYQSSRILQHTPELDSAVIELLEHARNMFRAERADLLLYPRTPADDALLTTVINESVAHSMAPTRLDAADPITRRVAGENHAFFHVPTVRERALTGVRQAMVAPLRGEEGLIGSMLIANRLTEGTSFLDEDLRLLETLANQAAVALENGQLEKSLTELSRLKEELRFQAYHDPLTGLANRSLFTERVDEILAAPNHGRLPVVLFLDLDNFKLVNDTLGHAAGDQLLMAAADRVRSCVRDGDLAARLGGDEFAILLEDRADLGQALAVTKRVLEALRVSFPIEGQEITISGSIGVAAARPDTRRADDLLRNADVAMYTAKEEGKNRLAVFNPTIHAAIVARHSMSSDLARAVEHGEIRVLYQPILALQTREIVGIEALARWRHPVRGMVEPDDFIGLAEESGLILALGRQVLEEACRETVRLDQAFGGDRPLLLTVNLSAAQLKQADFVTELERVLKSTGLPPGRLALEMTETAMFSDTQTTIARLEALRNLGVQIAIDDFGTGYSSLGYLRRFHVDVLKIARDFVVPSTAGADAWAFAHAIIALGRTLGLRIVAEGVEEQAQLDRLIELGCEYGQGFLFAHAIDGAGIQRLLSVAAPRGSRRAPGLFGTRKRAAAAAGAAGVR